MCRKYQGELCGKKFNLFGTCESSLKRKRNRNFPLLPPSQTAGNNQSLASLKEFLFSRTSGNIKYQSCGIGCSNVNSNNGRAEVSLSEWEIEDNKRNGVCESWLTIGSFGHHMSGEQHI